MGLELMEMMNQNYKMKKYDIKGNFESNIAVIQTRIMNAFTMSERSKEELEHFEALLFGNSKAFGENAYMYAGVDNVVYPTWQQIKENVNVKENVEGFGKTM